MIIPSGGGPLNTFKPSSSKYFDPNKIGEKTCLAMGEGVGVVMHALMKDRSADNYVIYSFKGGNIEDDGSDKIKAGAYNLNGCTDINKAHSFSFSSLENIMYYATDDAVYATSQFNTENLTSTPARYTVLPGEKITSMRMWKESGRCYLPSLNPDVSDEPQNILAKNRMIVLTTYNELTKEGKVIIVPVERTGEGLLCQDRKYHIEYGKFGRIVAIGSQKP